MSDSLIKVIDPTAGLKRFVDRKMLKSVKFMDENINVFKLSVAQVLAIQESAKVLEKDENEEGFTTLKMIIQAGVEGAADLTDEDFQNFPLDELSKLSNEVMKFSGIGQEKEKGK